ncbi:uncharacterized protein LOC142539895 isoform X2 [Primulina tabacum]|uniref:uncharacterized protein LOC142539895 isoform X2 n=1 Tax=Primulina tabacum TaxID=48773 RepID=UPI003F5AD45F
MSRREDRRSDSKRHRSRFDREPSPKRSRRDGRPATERPHSNPDLDKDQLSSDHKHHRRLQDALTLEAPLGRDAKVETGMVSKESEEKANRNPEGSNHPIDPAKVPRSRTYFQHDDRGITRQDGRGFGRRTDNERGWWRDHKAQLNSRTENKTSSSDARRKDEKAMDNRENNTWRHDGYFEMEANPKPPLRKRPSFSEQKITTADPEKADKSATAANPVLPNPGDRAAKSDKREERVHYSRYSDKPERPLARERESSKGEVWRGNFTSRDRHGSSGGYRGKDQFTGRQGYLPPGDGGRVEKWKHDLYNETNRSPTPKNDEDQISKIEALLAS